MDVFFHFLNCIVFVIHLYIKTIFLYVKNLKAENWFLLLMLYEYINCPNIPEPDTRIISRKDYLLS